MRLPIIEDTTRSVHPVNGSECYGREHAGEWYIGIRCPIDGPSVSPVGPFATFDDAMKAIILGDY